MTGKALAQQNQKATRQGLGKKVCKETWRKDQEETGKISDLVK